MGSNMLCWLNLWCRHRDLHRKTLTLKVLSRLSRSSLRSRSWCAHVDLLSCHHRCSSYKWGWTGCIGDSWLGLSWIVVYLLLLLLELLWLPWLDRDGDTAMLWDWSSRLWCRRYRLQSRRRIETS